MRLLVEPIKEIVFKDNQFRVFSLSRRSRRPDQIGFCLVAIDIVVVRFAEEEDVDFCLQAAYVRKLLLL